MVFIHYIVPLSPFYKHLSANTYRKEEILKIKCTSHLCKYMNITKKNILLPFYMNDVGTWIYCSSKHHSKNDFTTVFPNMSIKRWTSVVPFWNVALLQWLTVTVNVYWQHSWWFEGKCATAEKAALPLWPVVLSDSAELDTGLWKAHCHGKEAQCTFHLIHTSCSFKIMIQWVVTPHFTEQWTPNSFLVSYVLDHPSAGVVSPEQAQCWRLFPYGLQCHNTVPNA